MGAAVALGEADGLGDGGVVGGSDGVGNDGRGVGEVGVELADGEGLGVGLTVPFGFLS